VEEQAMAQLVGPDAQDTPQLTMRWELELGPLGSVPCFYPGADAPDSAVVVTGRGTVIRIDGAGREVFRRDLGEQTGVAPAVADLDGDGSPEIVAGARDGLIAALDGAGNELWRHRLGAPFPDFKCVVAAPLTNDDRPDLLLADSDGWVNCLDAAGRMRWRFKLDPYRASPPAVGDLDGDGSPEVVYGTDNHRVVCISADGRLRWQFQEPHNFGRSLALIADLGSGPEVLIASSSPPFGSHLHCLEGATGRLRWAGNINQQGYAALAVADLDGDRRPEVIAADKSNTIYCFDRDGERLWATHVGGHGIFWSPAIADVDGDGELEIVVGVRQARSDGRNLFLLTPQGLLKGEYSLGKCQNTSPLVGDIDHDGVLEVITSSPQSDALRCFTFGGPAREGAVVWPCFRGDSSLAGSLLPRSRGRSPRPVRQAQGRPERVEGRAVSAPERQLAAPMAAPQLGANPLGLRLPADAPQRALIEVSRLWRGQRDTRVHDLRDTSAASVELMPGEQEIEITLVDGADCRRLAGEKSTVRPAAPQPAEAGEEDVAVERQRARLLASVESAKAEDLDIAARRELAAAADALHEAMRRRAALHRFVASGRDPFVHRSGTSWPAKAEAGWQGSFAAWQDENPWDNVEPLAALPAAFAAEPVVEVWALRNEHEHAALNLVALAAKPVAIHAAVEGLAGHIELLRPVWMPTKFAERVPDMLLKSASATVLDVVPGEPCQLWLHLNTRALPAGIHEAALTLTSLGNPPSRQIVKLRLEVSPVTLPNQPATRVCVWRHVAPDGTGGLEDRIWRDLREHGVTVAYASPPAQPCDEAGNLVGEPEWSQFDESVRRLASEGALLFISHWGLQGSLEPWSPQWMRAMQAAGMRVDAHLHSLGIGNQSWVYYPVDEPCLTGDDSVERFLRHARLMKEAAPHIRVYANPAGAVTTEYLQRMSPYTDVWCPELAVVKQGPAEWLEIMRSGGRPVWTYEAPGEVRTLKPLGFYRMQPWVAARCGLDGSGYWVYSYDNLWGVGPEEPDFGAAQVEPDGTLTTMRRWEASRDGIEDATLLHLVADAIADAEARGVDASAARALRREALDAIAARQDAVDALSRCIIDYEMDFAAVQRYRRLLAEAIVELGA
jgi:outer membrane protein assembly factor BamB